MERRRGGRKRRGEVRGMRGGDGSWLRQRVVSREGGRLKLFHGHRLFSCSPSSGEDLCV